MYIVDFQFQLQNVKSLKCFIPICTTRKKLKIKFCLTCQWTRRTQAPRFTYLGGGPWSYKLEGSLDVSVSRVWRDEEKVAGLQSLGPHILVAFTFRNATMFSHWRAQENSAVCVWQGEGRRTTVECAQVFSMTKSHPASEDAGPELL
jgi:hypothetical protein